MMNSGSEQIYPNNVNFTTLEFVIKLLGWKNKHNGSNNSFDELIHFIGFVLSDEHKLPENYFSAC